MKIHTIDGVRYERTTCPSCNTRRLVSMEDGLCDDCGGRTLLWDLLHEDKSIGESKPRNKYDEEALDLLRFFANDVLSMIECMAGGDAYMPSAIGAVLDIGALFQVRDALVKARMEEGEDGK